MKRILLIFFLSSHFIFAQWVPTSGPGGSTTISGIALNGIYTAVATTPAGIYVSSNNGDNWYLSNNGLSNTNVQSIISYSGNFYAGTQGRIYKSTNNGAQWSSLTINPITPYVFICLAISGNNFFAGCYSTGGMYNSSDFGNNWTLCFTGYVKDIVIKDNIVFAATEANGIYSSTNNGGSWSQINNGLTSLYMECIGVTGGNLYAGGQYNLHISTNNGNNWNTIFSGFIQSIVSISNNIFAADWNTVYYSSNYGINWINVGTGIPVKPGLDKLGLNSSYIFTGIAAGGAVIWRRPLLQIITSVNKNYKNVPENFKLCQNYPNPFNPTTKIKFDISASLSFEKGEGLGVGLFIYDILGHKVATLVNEQLIAGTYEVEWDASNYSTGVYFYRLITRDYIDTKKMMFIK
jgi:photosystem II stability/assembly factor-like uncharacterized protein